MNIVSNRFAAWRSVGLVACVSLAAWHAQPLSAATILRVDFQPSGGVLEPDNGPWSAFSAAVIGPPATSIATQTYATVQGNVTLTATTTGGNGIAYFDRGPGNGGTDGVNPGFTLAEAYRDALFNNNGPFTLNISGLQPNTLYDLNLYSWDSVNGFAGPNAPTGTTYTLNVGTGPSPIQNLWVFDPNPQFPTSNGQYMETAAWTSNAAGVIEFALSSNNSQGPRINALELSTFIAAPVPEPSTLTLLAIGGLVAAGACRRKRLTR